MKVQEERLFKIPIDELRAALRAQYGVDLSGIEPYLDGDNIAFCLRLEQKSAGPETIRPQVTTGERNRGRIRRRRRKRNRIKTRGWVVISKITNSKGLVANVYEPFVRALDGRQITKSEQRKIVRQIMIQNGNDPPEDSVDYFLENTLEYLAKRPAEEVKVTVGGN